MSEVSRILLTIEHGDVGAASQLLPLVYDELRKLAARRMAHEQPGQTLEATALVHEAYLRLVGDDPKKPWDGRATSSPRPSGMIQISLTVEACLSEPRSGGIV